MFLNLNHNSIEYITAESRKINFWANFGYLQISINIRNLALYWVMHYDKTKRECTKFNDPDIVFLDNLFKPVTKEELTNIIEKKVTAIRHAPDFPKTLI